jgi:MFS superfamily sulfate permease-like transporter
MTTNIGIFMSSFFLIKKIAKNQEKVTGNRTDDRSPLPFLAPRPSDDN